MKGLASASRLEASQPPSSVQCILSEPLNGGARQPPTGFQPRLCRVVSMHC